MDAYRLLIKPSAAKELESIRQEDRRRVVRRIEGLATNPRPHGCEKLSGEDKYRVRQGNYRVIYLVNDNSREVIVFKSDIAGKSTARSAQASHPHEISLESSRCY